MSLVTRRFLRNLATLAVVLISARGLDAGDPPVDRARLQELVSKYDGQSIKPMGRAVLPELVRMYESSDDDQREKIAAIYADPGFFQRAGHDEIDALVRENEALGPKIDTLVGEWETLEREIEEQAGS